MNNTLADMMEKGRWIKIFGNQAKDKVVCFRCSVCGHNAKWVKGMESIYPSDICPVCKADMVARRLQLK